MKILLVFLISFSAIAEGPEYSRQAFDRGMTYLEKGSPVAECAADPRTKIFCEEGYWFRNFFLQWTNKSSAEKFWAYPLPLSGIQAVSTGMALAFRFSDVPDSFLSLGYFSKYIYDGWGFMTAMRAKELKTIPLRCPGGEFERYCEFGRARALFFSPRQPDRDIPGLSFARSMHGIETKGWMGDIGKALRGIIPLSSSLKNCLLSQHLLDCNPQNP